MWIKEIVQGLIDTYGTRDVYKLVDFLGITLIRKNLPNNKLGRFFRDYLGNEFIFISNNLEYEMEKVIIAHELGHAILHTDINVQYYTSSLISKCKIEKQANRFAAELLIPNKIDLNLDIDDTLSVSDLSRLLKVPKEFIKLKFYDKYSRSAI